jgi:hypothetical protein
MGSFYRGYSEAGTKEWVGLTAVAGSDGALGE